jgi:dihydrofolate reductase
MISFSIAAIVAVSTNSIIGKENKLPWHLPADLQHFKKLTSGHAILMGRKTYESIGKALPNRLNLILTRNLNFKAPNCFIINNLQSACEIAKEQNYTNLFVIGGAEVYKELLPFCQKIYLTEVQTIAEGDAFFELNKQEWQETSRNLTEKDEKNEYAMLFLEFERKGGLSLKYS